MDGTKLHFSKQELELYYDAGIILTKNAILNKLKLFLEELQLKQQEIIKKYISFFPGEVLKISPKVSKGENYRGLPWLVLDYPRYFEPGNTFAIRTLFWWGNFFSTTLHLSGRYKKITEENIFSFREKYRTGNLFICISEDQWQHHFEPGNFLPADEISKDEIGKIKERAFLKLGKKVELGQPASVTDLLCRDYEEIIRMLGG